MYITPLSPTELRAKRKSLGLTLEEVGTMIDLTGQAVGQLERGRDKLPIKAMLLTIIYKEMEEKRKNVPEFIGQIIDIFEDFLEDRKIDIPNCDKEDSGENAAIIYGMDYGELQSNLEAMMQSWGVI